jgi:putative spermidine/putrescine transport system substrate-binding protein
MDFVRHHFFIHFNKEKKMRATNMVFQIFSLLVVTAMLLTACNGAAPAGGGDLASTAKAEGQLTVIGLPHDRCNYGEAITGFSTKYGIKVNELLPDGGSDDEIEAVKANKDNKSPQAPDVIDVSYGFGPQLISEKLVQPYKASTWDSIPADSKDPDGNWYGDYYGVMAFEVNKDVVQNVPQDWADLLKPEYDGQFALAGDPRSSARRK